MVLATPPLESESPQTVTIVLGGGKRRSVPVLWVDRYLCVHNRSSTVQAWQCEDHQIWVVTHVPSGALMFGIEFRSLGDAIEAAETFLEEVDDQTPDHRIEEVKIGSGSGIGRPPKGYDSYKDHYSIWQSIATEIRINYAKQSRAIS